MYCKFARLTILRYHYRILVFTMSIVFHKMLQFCYNNEKGIVKALRIGISKTSNKNYIVKVNER